ncbi:hypothetical protein M5K25_008030 [Dendrobium thyrsiflorum]|uniref:Uncharacterized protein n=1 Tax=Dendrobium thyrsiflorum TaxID=117978 RepID=A0ABD0VEP9_DENTH
MCLRFLLRAKGPCLKRKKVKDISLNDNKLLGPPPPLIFLHSSPHQIPHCGLYYDHALLIPLPPQPSIPPPKASHYKIVLQIKAIPSAISFNWATEKMPLLPKHMYTTEPLGFLSSHFKHSLANVGCSPPLADINVTSWLQSETGPTFHTFLPITSRW